MTLTKRISKGSSLTYTELDGNFTHLGGDGTYQFPSTDGTSGHVLTTNGSGALSFTNLSTTPIVFSVQNISGPGAISLTETVSFITTTGTDAYTLADGTEGQLKIIIMKGDGGNGTLTPDNLVGFTAIRFTGVNNSAVLMSGSTGWNIIALQQATRIS
tara:strand:- start:805 stop:1278 length:474 start_codon:yes stop_codon:yes gene_type:complete